MYKFTNEDNKAIVSSEPPPDGVEYIATCLCGKTLENPGLCFDCSTNHKAQVKLNAAEELKRRIRWCSEQLEKLTWEEIDDREYFTNRIKRLENALGRMVVPNN